MSGKAPIFTIRYLAIVIILALALPTLQAQAEPVTYVANIYKYYIACNLIMEAIFKEDASDQQAISNPFPAI